MAGYSRKIKSVSDLKFAGIAGHRENKGVRHGDQLVAMRLVIFCKERAMLKDGATIAIPNDPTNLGRALLLLQKEKLITLKPAIGKTKVFATATSL
jgi:ABC-type metal ion transport system substrate-binding protein